MTSGSAPWNDRPRRVMNDPSLAFGTTWAPMATVERSIVLLQARLAQTPEADLGDDFLEAQYTALLDSLVQAGLCVITSFAHPTIARDVWFAHQRAQIARFRERDQA